MYKFVSLFINAENETVSVDLSTFQYVLCIARKFQIMAVSESLLSVSSRIQKAVHRERL